MIPAPPLRSVAARLSEAAVDSCVAAGEHGGMATSDIRWIQRLENFRRALSELEEQGLIQAFEFTHELS